MRAEEAIKCISEVLNSEYHYDESLGYEMTSYDFDWLEKAKEALEKQIPRTPDYEGDGHDDNGNIIYDTGYCPNCRYVFETDYESAKYCPECGQALDWSEEE